MIPLVKVGTSTVLTIIHVVLMVVEIRQLKIENFANKWQVPGFCKSIQSNMYMLTQIPADAGAGSESL